MQALAEQYEEEDKLLSNPVIDAMMQRKSIRSYTDQDPSEELLETVVRAGHQAPFAAQLCSLLLRRDRKRNPFGAPWLFTVCVDLHRMEQVMAVRKWDRRMSDLSSLLLGIQDAAYVAENMVLAAESLGMGSCFLGAAPYYAHKLIEDYKLPAKVFPLVQLTMGFPAEEASPRPRYPLAFALFEDEYPAFAPSQVEEAARVMDAGYLAQDYYQSMNAKIPLEEDREDAFTYDDYSWTEHISRKLGQWGVDPEPLLKQFEQCGFRLTEPLP